MFLALREFKHAKLRYGLITGVIVMVSALVFILSGLANGLASGNSEAIDAIDADRLIVASGSEYLLDRSRLSDEAISAVESADGVEESQPMSASVANVLKEGSDSVIGISLIGVTPGSFLEPSVDSGDQFESDEGGLIIDQSLANEGIGVGDVLTLDPSGTELTVIGITDGHEYRLSPTAFVTIDHWQELQPEANRGINLLAVRGDGGAIDALDDEIEAIDVGSKTDVIRALPGYVQMEGTLVMIQAFLVVIAAGVIAAFFFIITLQKMSELGVMKAIGATTMDLAKALVIQVVFLSIIGITVGVGAAWLTQQFTEGVVPYALDYRQMTLFGGILLVVAVGGTLLSLIRIARVDPLDAINKAG